MPPDRSRSSRCTWHAHGNTSETRTAGAELMRLVMSMYGAARITAIQLCRICQLAHEAHVPGADWKRYGKPEGLQTG
eukprot:9501688-Pyramimonas_sp.AAC.1